MSTPEEEFAASRSNHPKYVLRYTCHVEDEKFAQGVARRGTRSFEADGAPKLEVDYDRSRHVIKITHEGGEAAEFADLRGQTDFPVNLKISLTPRRRRP